MIEKWAAGKLSASEVQAFALDAEKQGACNLDKMAKMGNYGANPQNCYRALKNALGLPPGAPGFTWATLPTVSGDTPVPFLMPHDMFASFFAGQKRKFLDAVARRENAAL